jgi:hypothetical protein
MIILFSANNAQPINKFVPLHNTKHCPPFEKSDSCITQYISWKEKFISGTKIVM